MKNPSPARVRAIKASLFALATLPFLYLLGAVFLYPERLGANPAEYITRNLGDWALRFLLLTLAVTPLRKWTGWAWLARLRRMLGLFAFFYAGTHFLSYIAFDHVFEAAEILRDVVKRPFITFGFLSLLLMLPLALTSTNAMAKRLGAKRWTALHRLVYPIGILAVVHFWWMVKRDLTEPILYACILALLLGARLRASRRTRVPSLRPD